MAGSPIILATANSTHSEDRDSSITLVLGVSKVWVMSAMNRARAKITTGGRSPSG